MMRELGLSTSHLQEDHRFETAASVSFDSAGQPNFTIKEACLVGLMSFIQNPGEF